MSLRLPFVLFCTAALAVAACGPAAPATPEPAAPAPQTPAPVTPVPVTPAPATPDSATPATATPEPGTTPAPGMSPLLPSADPELEALLPDQVGELQLIKLSLRGETFADQADEDFQRFLDTLGTSVEQITVATATGFDADTFESAAIIALRAPGSNPDQLVSGFTQAIAEGDEQYDIEQTQLGGKNVWMARSAGTQDAPSYFYAAGEVMFIVVADEQRADEVFAQLP